MTEDRTSTRAIVEIQEEMRRGYARLINLVDSPPFRKILIELFGLPKSARPGYVKNVLLSKEAREARGLVLPDNIILVRSSFGDRRPTLFCVKTYLPRDKWKPWQNVNITFDENYDDGHIPRDARAWRVGLEFDEQARLMSLR